MKQIFFAYKNVHLSVDLVDVIGFVIRKYALFAESATTNHLAVIIVDVETHIRDSSHLCTFSVRNNIDRFYVRKKELSRSIFIQS